MSITILMLFIISCLVIEDIVSKYKIDRKTNRLEK